MKVVINADSGRWARRPDGTWYHYFSEATEITDTGEAVTSARVNELKTRERKQISNLEGEVERLSNVLALTGRAEDMSALVSTVEKLLRQQHAVREPDRSQRPGIPTAVGGGVGGLGEETPAWLRDKTSRAWRLLLSAVREFLDAATEEELEPEDLRIHAPVHRYTDWQGNIDAKQPWRMDTLERRRWTDVCELSTRTR